LSGGHREFAKFKTDAPESNTSCEESKKKSLYRFKEYQVQVGAKPDQEQLEIWKRGVVLEDGYKTAPVQLEVMSNSGDKAWLKIIMKEGRKRQIREIGSRIGLPVFRIKRTRIGSIKLGKLKVAEWRYLTKQEIAELNKYKTA
jgi:23S rRNA pseudouridine2605 synthase